MTRQTTPPAAPEAAPMLPSPEDFRAALHGALAALNRPPVLAGLSAQSIGRAVGLGKNTLGDFMAAPARDLRLGTAAQVWAVVLREAEARGVTLPAWNAGGENV